MEQTKECIDSYRLQKAARQKQHEWKSGTLTKEEIDKLEKDLAQMQSKSSHMLH